MGEGLTGCGGQKKGGMSPLVGVKKASSRGSMRERVGRLLGEKK